MIRAVRKQMRQQHSTQVVTWVCNLSQQLRAYSFFFPSSCAYVLLSSLWSDTSGSQFHITDPAKEENNYRVMFERNSHRSGVLLTMVVVYSAGLCRKVQPALEWLLDFSIGQRDHSCNEMWNSSATRLHFKESKWVACDLVLLLPLTW